MRSLSQNKKKYIPLMLTALTIAVFSLGGHLWSSQAKELKNNRTLQEQRIQELENRLNNKNGAINEDGSPNWVDNPLFTPTDKDVEEINNLLDSLCENGNAPNITKAKLKEEDIFGGLRFYNGYAQINTGCENDGGGYIAYLQRQSDNTWRKLFGAQDILDCEKANEYKIPKQILPNCVTNQGLDKIPNTN